MNGSFLLDTNIAVAYLNAEDAIRKRLAGITAYLPSIVLGELYFGALKSTRVQDNLTEIARFVSLNTVLGCDAGSALEYGQIKNQLRVKGRPLPENDMWIAAIARQYGLTLATRDEHFKQVDGLSIETW